MVWKKWSWVAAIVLLANAPSHAAELTVLTNDGHGHPVADAVVTVIPRDRSIAVEAHRQHVPTLRTIDQKDLTFIPYIEVFRPGDSVVFRNSDRTRHHVYSFSPVKRFEFVLAPGGSSAPMVLEKSGVIAAGCNIHDQMISYLYVSDAPWVARSDASGRVLLQGLPAGSYDVHAWHPRLRPGKPDLLQSSTMVGTAAQTLVFPMSLLPDMRRQFDREHTQY